MFENGFERVSKFMMPVLVVLSVVIAVYSVSRPGAMAGVFISDSKCRKLLMDDSRIGDGTDVLFTVNCDGYFDHIWFLYEERYVY